MGITNNITRRSALAALPTIAAVVAPGAANAIGGPAQPEADPIFPVIERHRKALDAYNEALDRHQQIIADHEAQRDPRGIFLYEAPEKAFVVVNHKTGRIFKFTSGYVLGDGETTAWRHFGPVTTMIYAKRGSDIVDWAEKEFADCADFDAWKAEKLAEVERWGRRDDERSREALHAWFDAADTLRIATAELCTRPTTLAGAVALLRAVAESYDGDQEEVGVQNAWTAFGYAEDAYEDDDPIYDNRGLLCEVIENVADVVHKLTGVRA